MDELLSYRARFPILEKTLYLINHSLGAMPDRVYDRLRITLREELGAAPSPAVQELHRRLLGSHAATAV